MQKSVISISGVLALGVILLLINGISDSLFSRFYIDLTDEGLYSLSKGSKNIVESLEEPIALRFYFSKTDGAKYPSVKMYGTRVVDLLKEYQRVSGGNITLETFDVRPDSEEEEWAQKYGLSPIPLPDGGRLFFGLVAVSGIGVEVAIPAFNLNKQEFLEYDITKLIYSLKTAKKVKITLISSLNIEGQKVRAANPALPLPQQKPWILLSQLKRFADVDTVGPDISEVPQDTDVLMVIHPKDLPEQTRYAIDQFAVRGGSVFIALDPYCEQDVPLNNPNNPMAALAASRSSNLPGILNAWGVSLKEKKIVGDMKLATKVSARRGSQPITFPVWITLGQTENSPIDTVNTSDVVTSQLENVLLPWPGSLEVKQLDGVTVETLLSTTNDSALYEENDIRFGGDNPDELLRKYKRIGRPQALAVRIRGKLRSSFPAKPGAEEVVDEENMSTVGGHLSQGVANANVVVVADVDFLADRYSAVAQELFGSQLISLVNDNLIFLANAIENLSGSDDLISLRSRGRFSRGFTRVKEIEARAAERWKREEAILQAKLNAANKRLAELQAGSSAKQGEAVFTQALMDEIQQFRDERQMAQRKLREVRRKLREDKEWLGTVLFVINTFGIPVLLVFLSIFLYRRRMRSSAVGAEEE